MSDNVTNYEDNVLYDQYYQRDFDCNSSSGGSIYQEIHGRAEELTMYSTDDEFMDATETIRSPLFADDPDDHHSAPILKQLTEEKLNTRCSAVDVPPTNSDSVNSKEEKLKDSCEKCSEPTIEETKSQSGTKNPSCECPTEDKPNAVTSSSSTASGRSEKNKSARSLRLPSAISLPSNKVDGPARGDGRGGPVGVSRIPVRRTSPTRARQQAPEEQNKPEPECCQTGSLRGSRPPTAPSRNENEEEEEDDDENSFEVEPLESYQRKPPGLPTTPKPTTRSLRREETEEVTEHQENANTLEGENFYPPSSGPEVSSTGKNNDQKDEKPRTKRARSQNKDDDKDALVPSNGAQAVTTEGAEIKRMRVGSRSSYSKENQEKYYSKIPEISKDVEKRKREIMTVRKRLAKDKLSLNVVKEKKQGKNEESNLKNQIILEEDLEQPNQEESLKLNSSNRPLDFKKAASNNSAQLESELPTTITMRAERNSRNSDSQKTTPLSSPRQSSPLKKMSIAERRKQIRKSREGTSVDNKGEVDNKTANMPEIKPLLFKSNQFKANQPAKRHQENTPSVPMKTSQGDDTCSNRVKNSLTEKRKLLMKQRDAANSLSYGDVQSKRVERQSREKTTPIEKQRKNHIVSSGIQKPLAGIHTPNDKSPNINLSNTNPEVQVKPHTATSKVTLSSLRNVYKSNYKRYEEQVGEIEKAKKRLCITVGKLDGIRHQIIQNNGGDPGEIIPSLDNVQSIVMAAPTIITTTKGMNTEVVEEGVTDQSFLLLGYSQIRKDNEVLRKQLEESKQMGYSDKKEADLILDLRQRIKEMSENEKSLKLAEKKQLALEKKVEEQQEIIVKLKNENLQIADLKKALKMKDQQLLALKKQNEDRNKEIENAQKRIAEANACHNTIQEEREKIYTELKKVKEERSVLEKQLHDLTMRYNDFEEREECLHTRLENEKKKVLKLEEELNRRGAELSVMEKKFLTLEMSSSSNIEGLTGQLSAREALLRKLEVLSENCQSQNREMCCLISDIFALKGRNYDADQIQAAFSNGKLQLLREELLKTLEERIEGNNIALEEAKSKISELQSQVKLLQIELEDGKIMSDRMSNVMSPQRHWESEKQWEDNHIHWSSEKITQGRHPIHNCLAENPIRESISHRDGDLHSIVPSMAGSFVCSEATLARNNFNELFVSLERKKRALVQMERKLQDIEEVHSHCAQKRTRNETRIAQLEMMLATYQK